MAPRNKKEPVVTNKKHVARLERERRQALIIKWVVGVIVVFVALGSLITAFLTNQLSFGKVNIDYVLQNQTVIQLGDNKVTLGEFQAYTRLLRQQLVVQYATYQQYQQFGMDLSSQLQQISSELDPNGAQTLGQQAVDALANDVVIRQEAQKRGITASETEIQTRIQEIFGYYPDGTPTPTVTPTDITYPTLSLTQQSLVTITPTPTVTPLETATPEGTATSTATSLPTITLTPDLTQTATITPTSAPTETPTLEPTATLTPTVAATETPGPTSTPSPTATPYTLQGFQDTFKQSMDNYAKIGLTEADYRMLVTSDILRTKLFNVITADVKPVQEQVWARHILVADQATAASIRQQLIDGADFAALAAKYSTDTATKDKGGDLGWFGKGQMAAEFETAAWSLKIGEISQPVQTQYGWHIIQVLGHENRPLTADAFNQLKQTTFNDWLTAARQQAETDGLLKINNIWMSHVPLTPDLTSLNQPTQ